VAGSKFGMLRLTTIGRRSGESRVAIIGYYEDGPNLVTLAMNGWGQKEPAWWLNLQGQPDTTVDLAGETRAIRARVAIGEERDRLWAKFADYPGWGDDIDGLASQRTRPAAVVVLEPPTSRVGSYPSVRWPPDGDHAIRAPKPERRERSMTTDSRILQARQIMTNAATESDPAVPSRRFRLGRRHLWLIPGLVIAVYANTQSAQHALGVGVLLLFGIVPHLPALLGIGQPHARGQMAVRAVPLFNVMHHPAPPLVIVGLAAAGVLSPFWFVGGLAWFSHIVVDRAFGDGLRTSDGWRRGWLPSR
jgi:deazaflavin-dependent oxidoreductase (nitroreductase family)